MRKRALWVVACCCALGLSLVACVPQLEGAAEPEATGDPVPQENAFPEGYGIQDVYDAMDQTAEDYAPEIRTLEDGTQVQLTPDVPAAYWHMGSVSNSYNNYYLNDDNRG